MHLTPDRFVRESFSDIEEAAAFFQATLPAAVVNILDMSSLSIEQGTFIDASMQEYRTDLLFSVNTKYDRSLQLYLLFEHKSYQDKHIFVQLLSYIARIYEKQTTPAPVLPFVFYHGNKEWRLGTAFKDYLQLKPADYELLGRYLPDFEFELFDVTLADVERLEITLYTSMFLQIMQAAADDEKTLETRLEVIFDRAVEFLKEEKLLEKLRKLFLFVFAISGLTAEQVSQKLSKISFQLGDEAMTTAQKLHQEGLKQGLEQGLEQGREEGLEEGLEQGLEKGRIEATRDLLLQQWQWKFGKVAKPEEIVIQKCTDSTRLREAITMILADRPRADIIEMLSKE